MEHAKWMQPLLMKKASLHLSQDKASHCGTVIKNQFYYYYYV